MALFFCSFLRSPPRFRSSTAIAWPIRLRHRPEPLIVLLLVSMLTLIVLDASASRPDSSHVHFAGRLCAWPHWFANATWPRDHDRRHLSASWQRPTTRSQPAAASGNCRFKPAWAPFEEPMATWPCSAWSPITCTPAIRFSHSLTGRISISSREPAIRRATPTCSLECFPPDDERTALAELEANSPRWILYVDTPPKSFLRIWPGSDPCARSYAFRPSKFHRHALSHGAEAGHVRSASDKLIPKCADSFWLLRFCRC